MRKLTILIDMDDTIEFLCKAWVKWLNNQYGTNVRHEDIREWDVSNFFPQLTSAQVYAPLCIDEFWETVEPIPGASETVKKLIDDGHKVYIVTASTWQTIPSKLRNVLFKYFPYLTWNNVIVTHNKQMIMGDVLIDDAPHNLIGGRYAKILVDAPHNWDFDENSIGAVRMKNWPDIYAQIVSIAEATEVT